MKTQKYYKWVLFVFFSLILREIIRPLIVLFRLIRESLLFALISLTVNKLRTFLSLLGITIGIFAIILVYSIVDSLEKNIRDSVSQLGDNVVYVQKWPWGGGRVRLVEVSESSCANKYESTLLRKRSQFAQNIAFEPLGGATAKRESRNAGGLNVMGVTFEYNRIWDFELMAGRYFTEGEMTGGKPHCIIGYDISEGLLFPEKIRSVRRFL